MKAALRSVLVAAVLTATAMVAPPAWAGGVNCPVWLGASATPQVATADTVVECWAPEVTYHENVALLHGDPPAYVTRKEVLVESEHTFDTRAELQAYIQDVLVVRGFWRAHPTRCDSGDRCLLVPPSAIDDVQVRQIIDRPR